MYASLDPIVKPAAIFASKHVFDLHHGNDDRDEAPGPVCRNAFLNPVPLMKLVEVIRTIAHPPTTFMKPYMSLERSSERRRCARVIRRASS